MNISDNGPNRPLSTKGYSYFLHFALAAAAVTILLLANENRGLKLQLSRPQTAAAADNSDIRHLQAGDALSSDRLLDLNNQLLDWNPGSPQQQTLLFVFTTTCPVCQKNLPAWAKIHSQLSSQYRIVGVSLDPLEKTRAYVDANNLLFPVFIPQETSKFAANYSIKAVPLTVLVDQNGTARKVWLGILEPAMIENLGISATEPT